MRTNPLRTGLAQAAAIALLLLGGAAQAAPVQREGVFVRDDDHYVLDFRLDLAGTLNARTLSWAQGGFAPVLSLFGPGGLLQQAVGSATTCGVGAGDPDPSTGFCWDAVFSGVFEAGDYALVLTQDGNLPLGDTPAAGFQQDGQPHYTGAWYLGDDTRSFINVDGSARSGRWALLLDGPTVNAVPEPGSRSLAVLALVAALAASARRRDRRTRVA